MSKAGKPAMVARASSRVSTLSKGMKVVDTDTRRDHVYRRISSLESDNYNEDKGEDAYDDNSEEDDKAAEASKKRKAAQGGASNGGGREAFRVRWSKRKVRSLERLIVEHGYARHPRAARDSGGAPAHAAAVAGGVYVDIAYPNYASVSAAPSLYPQRHFCSGCGQRGRYACMRCGLRTCSARCAEQHKESRCLLIH